MPNPATSIPLTDTLEFMQRLWALAHALERRSKQMAGAIGVTGPQRLVLRVVGLHPGMSAGDVAAILHVHPSTLTGVLQRLATQKLLIRAPDRADRRRVVLRLTPRGVQVNTTSKGTVEAVIARAISDTTARDRAACRRVIDRIVVGLGAATGRAKPRRTHE